MFPTLENKLLRKIPLANLQLAEPLTKSEQEFCSLEKLKYNDQNSEAMLKLANGYKNGNEIIAKDPSKAVYWLKKSAYLYNSYAMYELGIHYCEGEEKNAGLGFQWLKQAAHFGNIDAKYYLARCYEEGFGTEKNLSKAFYWFKEAASDGDVDAMIHTANFYQEGLGTTQNSKKAFF